MSIINARLALQRAAIREGQLLPDETQTALEAALSKASAVEAVIGCFEALRTIALADLPDDTREALRAAAAEIGAHNFHGLEIAAAILLAQMPPPPAPLLTLPEPDVELD